MTKEKKGKIPSIIELPSGSYRMQAFDSVTKKRISFTDPDCDEVMRMYLEWKAGTDRKREAGVTVGEAIDKYIDSCDGVLSPTTVSGYRGIRRNNLKGIMDMPICLLTQEKVQSEINREAKTPSPRTHRKLSAKTIANIHGLLSASLKMAGCGLELNTSLPAKKKIIIELPEPMEVMKAIKGTNIELPALLAMWLSLSMSEIRGIQVDAIKDGYLTIKESVVQVDGVAVHKDVCKAYERTRKLRIPEPIMCLIRETEAWQKGSGYIETRSGKSVTSRFQRVVEKAGLPHMRFHDLRHMNASVMIALNIPDKYAMERGGWKTKEVLNRVYQHTFSKERESVDDQIDRFFDDLYNGV